MVQQLTKFVQKGVVEAGYRGELVAKLVLLFGWDATCRTLAPPLLFTRQVTVEDFKSAVLVKEEFSSRMNVSAVSDMDLKKGT